MSGAAAAATATGAAPEGSSGASFSFGLNCTFRHSEIFDKVYRYVHTDFGDERTPIVVFHVLLFMFPFPPGTTLYAYH